MCILNCCGHYSYTYLALLSRHCQSAGKELPDTADRDCSPVCICKICPGNLYRVAVSPHPFLFMTPLVDLPEDGPSMSFLVTSYPVGSGGVYNPKSNQCHYLSASVSLIPALLCAKNNAVYLFLTDIQINHSVIG